MQLRLTGNADQIRSASGINLRDFDVKPDAVELRANARDLQTASQWLEDIQKHKDLSRYTWTMPQPVVRDDKTISLRMQGKAKP